MNEINNVFKTGIVGCGRIAGVKDRPDKQGRIMTHAGAYYQHPDFIISSAVDPDEKNLRSFQDTWQVKRSYTDLSIMLDREDLNVIDICSPSQYHFGQVMEIMKRKQDTGRGPRLIFVEKPVCLHEYEYDKLLNMANESKTVIVVNHTRRFDPAHRRLQEIIRSGDLGKLLQGRFEYYGGLFHNGSHVIDTLIMLLQASPVIVSVSSGAPGRIGDSCLDIMLSFDGAPVSIQSSDEKYYQLFELELRFTAGRIMIRDFGAEIVIEKAEQNKIGEKVLAPGYDSPWPGLDSPIYHAVTAIADYLRGQPGLAGCGVLLPEIESTMKLLWQAQKLV